MPMLDWIISHWVLLYVIFGVLYGFHLAKAPPRFTGWTFVWGWVVYTILWPFFVVSRFVSRNV